MSSSLSILSTNNLGKQISGKTILSGINFQIKKGEVKVILGPSGCGKSTFLRCLNGLEVIQEGEIFFEGENLLDTKVNWRDIRQKIGMVFQNYELFPNKTVLENILLGPIKVQKRDKAIVSDEARQLLKRIGLADKETAYPRELSGGQKQRVAIIRALCMKPDVMLFDEVTASLDPEMVREVLEVVHDLAEEGMTMIIVTHEMNFARSVADEVIFMAEGRVVEEGKSEQFFTAPQTKRAQQFLESLNNSFKMGERK